MANINFLENEVIEFKKTTEKIKMTILDKPKSKNQKYISSK